MSKLDANVIQTAKHEAEIKAKRIELAQQIFDELTGTVDSCECINLTRYDDYLLVDDGAYKWITTVDDFQSALDGVLERIINGKRLEDDISKFKRDAYSLLCAGCSDLYSTCGGDATELVKEISKDLTDDHVDEICESLGINLAETLGKMAEWKSGDMVATYTITDDDCQRTHTYDIFLQSADVCDRTLYRFAEMRAVYRFDVIHARKPVQVTRSGAATFERQEAIDAGIKFAIDADQGATIHVGV